MEAHEIQTALAAAVEEVLETMCFTTVLASAEGDVPGEGDSGASVIVAALHFSGSSSGGFRVRVPVKAARVLGAGFLGLEEFEVANSQAEEVVCELANMICGSVLSRLESKAEFQITHPEVAPRENGVKLESAGAKRWFDLGDGILAASLELQPAI